MLFKYCTGRCRQRLRSVPSFLLSGIAEPYIGARSVLITRGWGWDRSPSALRNSRLAASASRNAEQQEIDGGTLGIDGPIQVAPATLHANVGFVHSPRLVCRRRGAPNLRGAQSRWHNGLSLTAPLRRNNELRQSWQNRPQGFPHLSRLHELWRTCYWQPQVWQPCLGSERRRERALLSSGA